MPYFKKAVAAKPDYALGYINLNKCYYALGMLDSVAANTDRALNLAPPEADIYNSKGFILFQAKDYKTAIEFYIKANQLKKDNVDGYVLCSQCYYALNDREHWEKMLDTALNLDDKNAGVLNAKGYCLMLKEQYKDAIPYLRSALDINPGLGLARENLNNCMKALGDTTSLKMR